MQVGVYHLGRGLGEDIGAQHDALELLDVDGIELSAEDAELALLVGGQGVVHVGGEGVHLGNHGLIVRGDELGAVVEVGLEAVVVSGVVGSGEHYARVGIQLADGEGNLGGGAGAVEQGAVATQVGGDAGAVFGEVAGEVAGVVAHHDEGLAAGAFGLHKAAHVGDETAHGATHVEVVHAGGAHAGELGAAIDAAVALLSGGHHGADGAATQTTCAECQGLVEAVVELGPFAGLHQLGNGCGHHGVLGATGQQLNVFKRGFQQLAIGHSLLQRIENRCILHTCAHYSLRPRTWQAPIDARRITVVKRVGKLTIDK